MTFTAVVRKMMKKGGVARLPLWSNTVSCLRIDRNRRLQWTTVGVGGRQVVERSIHPFLVVQRDWIWSES